MFVADGEVFVIFLSVVIFTKLLIDADLNHPRNIVVVDNMVFVIFT